MKALAEKQSKANNDYANASSDYATKSEEIKKLEAQLETLAKQGTDLGAKLTKVMSLTARHLTRLNHCLLSK